MKDIIINDDCFEVFKQLSDNSVDTVFTSPPHNRKRNDKYKYFDDKANNYFEFLCQVTRQCLRVAKNYVIINIQKNYYNKRDVFKYIGEFSDRIVEIIIWEKSNPMPASGYSITNAYEFFIVLGNRPLKSNHTYTKNVITSSVNSNMPKNHKAVMKQEICDWFVNNFTKQGELIFDPFVGVGTTAISCMTNNRHYLGVEIVKEYYDMAVENITRRNDERI